MKIQVNAMHIVDGRIDCHACPIALALMEVIDNEEYFVSVDWTGIAVGDYAEGNYILTEEPSAPVAQFIKDFDAGKPVEPFEFDFPLEEVM